MTAQPLWTRSLAESASALDCGVSGLTSADAIARLTKYGRNADAQVREPGLIVSVGRRLLEPMCLILIAAALVSAGTGDESSALIILVILGVSVTLDTVQEGSAKRAAEALRQSVALKAQVKRDGTFVSIDAETVVPGDVFRVGVGDIIPADALVLEANAFTANEAALTGEPYAVIKQPGEAKGRTAAEASNALFRGAVGQTGDAVALAVGTGPNTLFGEAAKSLNAAAEISPFQHDLRELGYLVALCTDKAGTLTSAQIELAGSAGPDGKTNDRPAMLAAICARLGGDRGSLDEALTKARPDAHSGWTRRGLSPFDYQRRLGAVLADGMEGLTLIVKGAPEAVVEACTSAGGASFDAAARTATLARVHDLASNGLRAVAVASRPWTGPPRDPTPLGEWFGFQAPPLLVALALGGIVAAYLVCAELFKPLAITGRLRHTP